MFSIFVCQDNWIGIGIIFMKNRSRNLNLYHNVYLLVCHVPFPAQDAVRILHRSGNHMTDKQIYFSGWPRFVHTCLGLIRLFWRYFYLKFENLKKVKILCNAPHNISSSRVQSRYWRNSHPDQVCTKRGQPGKRRLLSIDTICIYLNHCIFVAAVKIVQSSKLVINRHH